MTDMIHRLLSLSFSDETSSTAAISCRRVFLLRFPETLVTIYLCAHMAMSDMEHL